MGSNRCRAGTHISISACRASLTTSSASGRQGLLCSSLLSPLYRHRMLESLSFRALFKITGSLTWHATQSHCHCPTFSVNNPFALSINSACEVLRYKCYV